MKHLTLVITIATLVALLFSCSGNEHHEKGFRVSTTIDPEGDTVNTSHGISKDSLAFEMRPGDVLLTGNPRYRLVTVYKVNYRKDSSTFIGSSNYYGNSWESGVTQGYQWHSNYMPGLEAVYGYNMVNISHYDNETKTQRTFFEKPVLMKTLYYPSFFRDSLNDKPIVRSYFMASVYDDDTNKDGYVNLKDLRRFYLFDADGKNKRPIVPINYSVVKSEYDAGNDFMHLFALQDENANGKIEKNEPMHIFWIDLKKPEMSGRAY